MKTKSGSWREESTSCPICGSSESTRLGRRGGSAHRAGLGIEATVVRCRVCHVVYCNPKVLPLDNPYEAYQGDTYFAAQDRAKKLVSSQRLCEEAERLLG